MKVMFLALTSVRAGAVARQCDFLLDRGVDVTVVTADPGPWGDPEVRLDDRVEVVSLAEGEGRQLLVRVERVVLPTGTGPVRGLTGKVHRRLFLPGYRVLRPYLLWRVARRDLLPGLDPAVLSEVVVVDAQAVPLGWRLARSHPGLKVSLSLDRAAYGDTPAGGAPSEAAEV